MSGSPPLQAARPGLRGDERPAGRFPGFDRVGLVPAAMAVLAVALPLVTFKPNRIAAGRGVAFWASLPPVPAAAGGLALVLLGLSACLRMAPALRLGLALLALALLAGLIGLAPGAVVPPKMAYARVSFAAGFWTMLLAFGTMAADGAARLALRPRARVLLLGAVLLALAGLLASGWWGGLSLLQEYAAHRAGFWAEAATHVALAFGSLLAAVLVGLPLGIGCARRPRLRGAALPVLNVIQTIPSIAMYGLMMVPLGLLAGAVPLLGALGIRGIGVAPAALALFLYALLPVVANTAVGLDGVPRDAVEAARGMGMESGRRLRTVELPLAAPVILTGIRIVLVQNIGLVTVAALIGGGGFGTFVFQGTSQAAIDLVLLGAVPTVILAFTAAVLLDAAAEAARRGPA